MTTLIRLNVGGRYFMTTVQTLNKYPDTLLGKLVNMNEKCGSTKDETGAYFFDRNDDYFPFILEFYRTGKIVYPTNVDPEHFEEEMQFWGLPLIKLPRTIDVATKRRLDEIVNFPVLNFIIQEHIVRIIDKSFNIVDVSRVFLNFIWRFVDKIHQNLQKDQLKCIEFFPVHLQDHKVIFNFRNVKITEIEAKPRDETYSQIKFDGRTQGINWHILEKRDNKQIATALEYEL